MPGLDRTKIVIFGAGQYGQALFRLLNRDRFEIAGFADNRLAGTTVCGLPVFAPAALPGLGLRGVILAVKGEDRRAEIVAQITALGLRVIPSPLDALDIRGGATRLLAEQITEMNVPGAAAELGVYQGDFALALAELFPERPLYLFDTFEGFAAEDITGEDAGQGEIRAGDFGDAAFEAVRSRFDFRKNVFIQKGRFRADSPEAAALCGGETFCFVSIDADLYLPVYEGLRFFYPRLSPGGCILVHDAGSMQYPGAGKALKAFCAEEGILPFPLPDLHGSAVVRRGESGQGFDSSW